MFKGILLGIGITVLVFVLVWLFRKKSHPTVLTYIVVVIALIVLSVEGIRANSAIKSKRHSNDTFAIVQTAMLTYLPSQAKDYTITLEQASALKLGLKFLLPDVSKSVSISDIANKTVAEASDAICLTIDERATAKVRKSIFLLSISVIVLAVIMCFTFSDGNRSRSASTRNTKGNRNTHRSHRVSHRSRRQ